MRRHSVLTGIVFMCLAATFLFPLVNLSAKYLALEYAVIQVIWARYTGHLVYTFLVFGPRRGLGLFATRRPAAQLMRSAMLPIATMAYFFALRHISLPIAAAVNFAAPLVVTLLAVPLLKEEVGWRRWLAVGFGFAGVLVVMRPGTGAVHWSASLVLVTVFLYAMYQILTRRVAVDDPPETSLAYVALVAVVVTSFMVPFVWRAPETMLHLGVFLAIGLFGGVGHFLLVKAFEQAPASIISPFGYLQLIGAALLGYLVFGNVPDRWMWIGAAMIIASGLYIAYREGIRPRSGVA